MINCPLVPIVDKGKDLWSEGKYGDQLYSTMIMAVGIQRCIPTRLIQLAVKQSDVSPAQKFVRMLNL